MSGSLIVGVVNVDQFTINGTTETHYICRDPEGRSVCLRLQAPLSVGYCAMVWLREYRHQKFRPTHVQQMPLSVGCSSYLDVVAILKEFPVEVEHRYEYYCSGETFALAEVGEKRPTCLHVIIKGRSSKDISATLGKIRKAVAKLGAGVRFVKDAKRTEDVSRTVMAFGLKLYGVYEIRRAQRPPAIVSRMDLELIVDPRDLVEVEEPSRELKAKLYPRILYMDAEQMAAFIGNFSTLNQPEDSVIMMSVIIDHPGHAIDGQMHMVAMDSTIGRTLETDDGTATVHRVAFGDETSFWLKLIQLIHQVQPDYIMAWNGYGYDFPLMMTRLYAFSMKIPIPEITEITTKPPSGTHMVSRYESNIECIRNYKRTSSAFFGDEPVYIPLYPGIGMIDAMVAYKAFLDPTDGIGLNKCAQRHGLPGKKDDVSYTDITYAYRSSNFYHNAPPTMALPEGTPGAPDSHQGAPDSRQGIAGAFGGVPGAFGGVPGAFGGAPSYTEEAQLMDATVPYSELHPERQAAISRAIRAVIPNSSSRAWRHWQILMQTKPYDELVRLMDILPYEETAEAMARVYRYAMYDSVVMRDIMNTINFWPTVQQFGLMQFLTPVIATSSGQVGKVWHSMWKKAVTRQIQMSQNPHKKYDKYGGGQVLYPTFKFRTADGRYVIVVIYDFNSMYPSEIRNDNLSADTYVPDWLAPYNLLETKEFASHRPKEIILRFAKGDLPYGGAIDSSIIDHVNVAAAEGDVHIMFAPHERHACDIIGHKFYDDAPSIAHLWRTKYFSRIREVIAPLAGVEHAVGIDELQMSYPNGTSDIICIVALLETDYDHRGAPVLFPVKVWMWKTQQPKGSIRMLEIVGGRKDYPAFVVGSAQLGLLPDMIIEYLEARAFWKREMKRIKKLVAKCKDRQDYLGTLPSGPPDTLSGDLPGGPPDATEGAIVIRTGDTNEGTTDGPPGSIRPLNEDGTEVIPYSDEELAGMPTIVMKLIGSWPKELMEEYIEANIRQATLKIGANSAYGASGCDGPLYHPFVPTSITSNCRNLLGHLIALVRRDGEGEVINPEIEGDEEVYGDTDSVMAGYDPWDIARRVDAKARGLSVRDPSIQTREPTVREVVDYCNSEAAELNRRLKLDYPDHGVSCDGIAAMYFQLYKKKYAYVPIELREKFLAARPRDIDADLAMIHDCVVFKGISSVKSDQTPWASTALEHIIAAALSGATVEEIERIYAYHISLISSEPVDRLLKTTKVNLAKTGAGNDAARLAVLRGHPIRINDYLSWAQLRDGSYSAVTTEECEWAASREEISEPWVASMIDKEYQRVLHVTRLVTSQ